MKRNITLITIFLFNFSSFSQILNKSIDEVDFIHVMKELNYMDEFNSTLKLIKSESKETSEENPIEAFKKKYTEPENTELYKNLETAKYNNKHYGDLNKSAQRSLKTIDLTLKICQAGNGNCDYIKNSFNRKVSENNDYASKTIYWGKKAGTYRKEYNNYVNKWNNELKKAKEKNKNWSKHTLYPLSERAQNSISKLENIYYNYKNADINNRDKLKNKNVFSEKIKWLSLEEAINLQVDKPKKILIYLDFKNNVSKLIKQNLSNNDAINYLNKKYYSVNFITTLNSKKEKKIKYRDQVLTFYEFANSFGINSFPHLIFLDEKSNFIAPIGGNINLQDFELYLKFIANDDFKEIKSKDDFKNYKSNFKSAFSSN
ncbi:MULTISPECIES: hypothetical protein [Tenacibaculum]|uniref:hypothetical protein n=1 Tax=Tenacibaculum TaxID=104267 RepID=UPI001F0B5FD5|nr:MULTISPECIES: hypothetical protein [Tenacibaculum]MCH3882624.1 hypothetical protein [Tenacibaculum aquimarinum]MDO6600671.1 hypothetical protein [Tenacibaculum sp. 1_MG-2023]